jgi:pimeloyl-ACP methyl ester carboxylesterase
VFEHSSHLPHLEEPEAYLQALRGFGTTLSEPLIDSFALR